MSEVRDTTPFKQLLRAWSLVLMMANAVMAGFLMLSGLMLVPQCGAWRWFGAWQLVAAALVTTGLVWAVRARETQPGRALLVLLIGPLIGGLSLGWIMTAMQWFD